MDFYVFLKSIMNKRGLSIPDIARFSGLSDSTLRSAIDRKQKRVALDVALKLSAGLNIPVEMIDGGPMAARTALQTSNNTDKKEYRIGRAYGKATPREQSIVEQVLEPYLEDAYDPSYNIIPLAALRQSRLRTSAGTGILLDEESMITVMVRLDALPRNFERNPDNYFCVPVAGNSMEPRFHDGDILLVSKEPVNVGEIGVFTMEGEGYVKELGRGVLLSLNSAYADIPLTEDVRCNGKAIGVLDPTAVVED